MNDNQNNFNIIFCSQGSALKIFNHLLPELNKQINLNHIGIFVADQAFFSRYISSKNNFSGFNIQWLKEWEINKTAQQIPLNYQLIHRQEQTYGQPNLWPALMCDRRIMLGQHSKYTQDYTPRLSHRRMLALLQTATTAIEDFVTRLQPHAIIGFNMVTLSEFLFYLIAKQQNIPYWQIKNAKIQNLVTLFPDPLNISAYLKQQPTPSPASPFIAQAKEYLKEAKAKNSTYEGHVILKSPSFATIFTPQLIRKLASGAAFSLLKQSRYPHDHQSAGLKAVWHFNINKPLKAASHHRWLSRRFLSPHQLRQTKYIFFPLHTEPEIALSIYGRFHQNQIEVIRNIAQSIPVTWQLVVKDHPRSLGLRKLQYYRKLLAIPNVRLVSPYLPSYDVIEHAQAIVTISSWVGFEAVMSQKPVITMGECTYNALPDTMVTKNKSYQQLANDILRAIENYRYNESAILDHIATIMSISYPINMYSEILAKPNRHTSSEKTADQTQLWSRFAQHITSIIQQNN